MVGRRLVEMLNAEDKRHEGSMVPTDDADGNTVMSPMERNREVAEKEEDAAITVHLAVPTEEQPHTIKA